MNPNRAISLRELAFVRDVLIPRAWVQGAEVDELLQLRGKIDGIFVGLREEQAPADEEPAPAQPHGRKKKPRHPKKRRRPPPPAPDES